MAGAIGEFTAGGPIVETLRPPGAGGLFRAIEIPDAASCIGAGDGLGRIDAETHAWRSLEAIGRVPSMNRINGLAYDSMRRRVMVCSGDGYLCAYSPEQRRWLSRKKMALVLDGLAYAREKDVLYAIDLPEPDWHSTGTAEADQGRRFRIHKLDTYGELISTVDGEESSDFPDTSRWGRQFAQLAYADGYLLVLTPPRMGSDDSFEPTDRVAWAHIYVLDPETGNVVFSGESKPRSQRGGAMEFCWPRDRPAIPTADCCAAWESRIAAIRADGSADRADMLSDHLDRIRREQQRLQAPAADGRPEMHVVGVYHGQRQGDDTQPEEATVRVANVGKPITLVLGNHETVRWHVELQEGAKLDKVVLCGYAREQEPILGLPNGTTILDLSQRADRDNYLRYVEQDGPGEFRACVRAMLGAEVTTLQHQQRYEGTPFRIGTRDRDWRGKCVASFAAQMENELMLEDLRTAKFSAIQRTGHGDQARSCLAEFTLGGPLPGTERALSEPAEQLAFDPQGPTYYGLIGSKVYRLDADSGTATRITDEQTIPDSLRGTGLAMDTKRHRLLVHGTDEHRGIGVRIDGRYTYAYDLTTKKWQMMAECSCDIGGLAYVEQEDTLYGLVQPTFDGSIKMLCKLNPHGALIDAVPLSEPLLWSVSDGSPQLIPVRDRLVVITPPRQTWTPDGERCESQIFVIDPRNGRTAFAGTLPGQ